MSTTEREVVENNRTFWTVYIVIAIISLLLIGGVIYIARKPAAGVQQTKLEGALRAGAPDFEKIKARITVDKPEATIGDRAIGDKVMTLTTTVRNFTGKTIDGLEMRGAIVDFDGNTIKERTVVVVPNNATGIMELEPSKFLAVPILLEGIKTEPANFSMEVTAVRFR